MKSFDLMFELGQKSGSYQLFTVQLKQLDVWSLGKRNW
jgi:hypothetical protein